ncbi:MAG: hypothetical protein ACRDOE_26955, partial [Streptosporangiaceae bacterium]
MAAERTKAVREWAGTTDRVLFLTGTPMENRVEEFRVLVNHLRPPQRAERQHRGQAACPVPALAGRPRHPQPHDDRDQAQDERQRDELGRGEAAVDVGLRAVGKGGQHVGQRDDQVDGADGGARAHEP